MRTTHTTPEARDKLSKRIKDLLMKQWTIVGIPLVITTVSLLAKVEKDMDMPVPDLATQDANSHYRRLDSLAAVETRGLDDMIDLYRSNLEPIMATWGAHEADFRWLEKRVIYGLFLSDHDFLDKIERSIITISSMMPQGLHGATMWHIRGLRRLGVSVDDAERVCDIVKYLAVWCGRDATGWIRACEVDMSE